MRSIMPHIIHLSGVDGFRTFMGLIRVLSGLGGVKSLHKDETRYKQLICT